MIQYTYKPKQCEKCGCEYIPTGGTQKYCETCGNPEARAYRASHKRGTGEHKPKQCKNCGCEYIPTVGYQKYCKECQGPARKARQKAYDASYERRAKSIRDAKAPKRRASKFLGKNRDCTSTMEDVAAIYAASINAITGEKGTIGSGNNALGLDHIHGGPAVGLIPHWLNRIIWAAISTPGAKQYLLYRLQLEGGE
jgi:hypothetical protein